MELFETFEHDYETDPTLYIELATYNELIIKSKIQMEFNDGVCKVKIPKFFKNEEYEMIKKLAKLRKKKVVVKELEEVILNPDYKDHRRLLSDYDNPEYYKKDDSTVTAINTFFGEDYNKSIWMLFDSNYALEYSKTFNIESFVELFYWYYDNGYFEKDIVISKVRLINSLFDGINYLITKYEYVYIKLLKLILKCEHNVDLIISFLLNFRRLHKYYKESFYSSEIMDDEVMIDILLYTKFPIEMRYSLESTKIFKMLNEMGDLKKYLKYREMYNKKHLKTKTLVKLIKYGDPYLNTDYIHSNFFDLREFNFEKIKEKKYTKHLIDFLRNTSFPRYRVYYPEIEPLDVSGLIKQKKL